LFDTFNPSSEFQDFVNTLETELAHVKEQWRLETAANQSLAEEKASLAKRNALLAKRVDALEAELNAEKQTSAQLRQEVEQLESTALQQFVRGVSF
jgi:hypothetical protein